MSTEVKTDAQFSLRVLLRGLPLGEGATFDLVGSRAVVTAIATRTGKLARFPDAEVEKGDLEAVTWCEPDRLGDLLSALEADPRVIAIEALIETPGSERPDPV